MVSLVVLGLVGLGVGLWLHFRPMMLEVKPSTQISFGPSEIVDMTEMRVKDVNLFS